MRPNQLQYTLILLIAILSVAALAVGCDSLSDQNKARLNEFANRGQVLASTVAANAPSYAATAKSMASTAIAAAPTIAINAQSAAATASANTQAVATIASAHGGDVVSVATNLQGNLQRLQPDANGRVVVSISEAELTGALMLNQVVGSAQIDNVAATIRNGRILLSGDMLQPVAAPFAVSFIPYVEDGQAQLAIEHATIGRISVPATLTNQVEQQLNQTIVKTVTLLPQNVYIIDLNANQGYLTITANTQN